MIKQIDLPNSNTIKSVTSKLTSYNLRDAIGVIASIAFIVCGATGWLTSSEIVRWCYLLFGVCGLVSHIGAKTDRLVRTTIEEDKITFQNEITHSTIPWTSVFDYQIQANKIKFRYQGLLDILTHTIHFKQFEDCDKKSLVAIFKESVRLAQSKNTDSKISKSNQ